jgi:dipeptidyl-peptidase-4
VSPIFRFFVCLLAVCCHGVVIAAEDAVVLDIERIYASPDLAGPAPRAVKISPDSTRVSFLRGKESDRQQLDLWEYNLEDSEVRLLVDSQGLIAGPEDVSEEELARRERLRIVGQRGIVSYQFSPDGSALLFPLSSDLFLYEIATRKTRRLTATEAGETDPKFSPDGRYISFVRDRDLYLVDVATGVERRLTRDGGGMVSNGMAEFIAQEEMKRFTGYWWAPDSESIAFTRVDESGVEIAKRFEVYAEEFKVYEQRYPRTGTANAVVRLGVIEVDDGDTRWMNIGENDDVYLARVNWFPGSKYLAVQRQSRDQKTLELLKVEAAGGAASVLLTERSEYWINLHNDLAFLDSAPQFIWSSERSGFKHLYLYGNDGTLVRPLTEGDWEVVHGARNESAILHVGEKEGLVYVSGTLDSPIERNLYAIALDGSAPPRRLSTEPGWHRAAFADNGKFYVDTFQNATTPPQVAVHRADGSRIGYVEHNALNESHPFFRYLDKRPATRFGTLAAADGQSLYYRIKTPPDFDENGRYPVVVYVYGGPGGQTVTNTWNAGFLDVLASNGFVVFTIDNRGTGYRGVEFDAPLYRRLGHVEVADQLTGIEYLRSLPYVDADRIGVFGWSYGGYMALMCMFQAPEVFAAGVSGAPVTDWTLYDTHYTERFLGTPRGNPDGYESSSVFPYVENLTGPLLVIHGMADDNVLFTNSTKLFKSLQDGGRDFDMMTYPGSKHGLMRITSTGKHASAQILRFFRQHLQQ